MTQPAFWTFPARMHWVQTGTRRTVPLRTAFTRWTFEFQTLRFRLFAWDTLFPNRGPLPQIEHFAMASSGTKTSNFYHG